MMAMAIIGRIVNASIEGVLSEVTDAIATGFGKLVMHESGMTSKDLLDSIRGPCEM